MGRYSNSTFNGEPIVRAFKVDMRTNNATTVINPRFLLERIGWKSIHIWHQWGCFGWHWRVSRWSNLYCWISQPEHFRFDWRTYSFAISKYLAPRGRNNQMFYGEFWVQNHKTTEWCFENGAKLNLLLQTRQSSLFSSESKSGGNPWSPRKRRRPGPTAFMRIRVCDKWTIT